MLRKATLILVLLTAVTAAAQEEPVSKPIRLNDGSYVGEIRAFASTQVPDGWLICDGKEYPIKTGATDQLFKVIGTLWGSTKQGHFRVPDLRGQFLRGWNMGRAANAGGDQDVQARSLPTGAPGAGDPAATRDRVGSQQTDAVVHHIHIDAGHKHGYDYRKDYACGSACGAATGQGYSGEFRGAQAQIGGPVDTSGSPVRTGNETHPKNVYVIFAIRNQGVLPAGVVGTQPVQ